MANTKWKKLKAAMVNYEKGTDEYNARRNFSARPLKKGEIKRQITRIENMKAFHVQAEVDIQLKKTGKIVTDTLVYAYFDDPILYPQYAVDEYDAKQKTKAKKGQPWKISIIVRKYLKELHGSEYEDGGTIVGVKIINVKTEIINRMGYDND